MKNYCKKCGMCCKAICLLYSIKELKKSADKGSVSAIFMVNHWSRISKQEALQINPYLKLWVEKGRKGNKFYKCDCFNPELNICNTHNETANVCSGYPLYGKEKLNSTETFYTSDCGFNRDDLKEIQK